MESVAYGRVRARARHAGARRGRDVRIGIAERGGEPRARGGAIAAREDQARELHLGAAAAERVRRVIEERDERPLGSAVWPAWTSAIASK